MISPHHLFRNCRLVNLTRLQETTVLAPATPIPCISRHRIRYQVPRYPGKVSCNQSWVFPPASQSTSPVTPAHVCSTHLVASPSLLLHHLFKHHLLPRRLANCLASPSINHLHALTPETDRERPQCRRYIHLGMPSRAAYTAPSHPPHARPTRPVPNYTAPTPSSTLPRTRQSN